MHHLNLNSLSGSIVDIVLWIHDISADALLYLLTLNGRAFILLLCCLLTLQFIKGSAAMRHFVATLSVVAVALLPLTSRLGPAFDITVETSYLQEIGTNIATTETTPVTASHYEKSILTPDLFYLGCLAVYFLGFVIILAKVLLDNLKLLFLLKAFRPVSQQNWLNLLEKHRINLGIRRRIGLRRSDLNASPSTCGVFRPVILLPRNALHWPDHLVESTLLHELAHIKRCDWLVQQIVRCIYAFYWLNPLCRIAINKIFAHAETACDDLAINSGVPNLDYAECLVDVAEQVLQHRSLGCGALTMASRGKHGPLSNRVLSILNMHECRAPVTKTQILVCLSAFLCVLLPLASVRASFIERKVEPPGPVYFEKKLSRFTYPPEDHIYIPVTILPKRATNEQIEHEQAAERPKPGELLADLKKRLVIDRASPTINVQEATDKEALKAVSNEKGLLQKRRQPKIASGSSQILKNRIKKTLSDISQTLSNQKNDSDKMPLEALSASVSHSPINMVIPDYPYRALRRGIEGEVIVEYSIDKHGKVIEAEIVSAEPESIFNRHVLKAIKSSTFNPRKIDGKPVPAEDLVEKYVFVLES